MQELFKTRTFLCILFIVAQIAAFSQEYTYDANGDMTGDANKEIARIHYNISNLPDTIAYKDGRTIVYSYTALGQKLSQRVVASNGKLLQKQDYIDDFQYTNDTLREIRHSEGRVVPNKTSTWEYQYHLSDHLGNVRSTITSKTDTIEFLATMETESAAREQIIFDGLEKNRVNFAMANHTTRGNEVVQLKSDKESAAVSMDLAVQSGDVIYLQVHAYYEGDGPRTTKNAGSSLSTILLPIVLGAFNGAPILAESQRAILSTSNITGGLAVPSDDKSLPKAHLNYQLFDRGYKAVDAGFVAVSEKASFKGELLTLGPIKIQRSGYLYAYLSNTSEENIPVYFDDLKITHVPTPVVQEDGYDPFGMTLVEQHSERFGELPNNHLFNGKEMQHDFDLNWYDYGARMYDPALGRWHVPDLLTEKYPSMTSYQYAMNNPVNLIDPAGQDVVFHQAGADKGRYDKLTSAVNVLRKTNEGKTILSKAENNKDVRVYVAGTNTVDGGKNYAGTTKVYAKEFDKTRTKWVLDINDLRGFARNDFGVFVGLDIAADVKNNKDVYFVIIDVDRFNDVGTANLTGHELQAHVNINQSIKGSIKPGDKIDITTRGTVSEISVGDLEHRMFGSAHTEQNGNPIITAKGTSADRLNEQLTKLWMDRLKQLLPYGH
jgi:RHS repeat-associated protein